MLNRGKTLSVYLWALWLVSLPLLAANVSASLSANEVEKGSTVDLVIRVDRLPGEKIAFPDLHKIGDAKVLSHREEHKFTVSIVNNKKHINETTIVTVTLLPGHSMTIPPLTVRVNDQSYQTVPLHLEVVKSKLPATVDAPFKLLMQSDKSKAHVGEPIVLTLSLMVRSDVDLSPKTSLAPPPFDGFDATQLPGQRSYHKGNYTVQELRYVLIPQHEGSFTILPAAAHVGVMDRTRFTFFLTYPTKFYDIKSQAIDITVLPKPKEAELVGKFKVDAKIDKSVIEANEASNLTITIEGEGDLESFELPDYRIDGVTIYSDDASVHKELRGGKLYSVWTKKYAMIASRDFKIPERSIKVFNPDTQKLETLTIPSFEVHVKAPAAAQANGAAEKGAGIVHSARETVKREPVVKETIAERRGVAWYRLFAVLLLGMALGAFLTTLRKRMPKLRFELKDSDEALRLLMPHVSKDAEVEAMVRKLMAKKRGEKVEIDKKALKALLMRYRV